MDFAVVILSLTSLPILLHNIYWVYREKEVDEYYGILAGIYTLSAAIGVAFGYPGNLVMPIAFIIIGIGALHSFAVNKKKMKIVKSSLFIAIATFILLSGVFL